MLFLNKCSFLLLLTPSLSPRSCPVSCTISHRLQGPWDTCRGQWAEASSWDQKHRELHGGLRIKWWWWCTCEGFKENPLKDHQTYMTIVHVTLTAEKQQKPTDTLYRVKISPQSPSCHFYSETHHRHIVKFEAPQCCFQMSPDEVFCTVSPSNSLHCSLAASLTGCRRGWWQAVAKCSRRSLGKGRFGR